MILDRCPSCSALPVRLQLLEQVRPYESVATKKAVLPQRDDYRCRWCGSQFNARELAAQMARA